MKQAKTSENLSLRSDSSKYLLGSFQSLQTYHLVNLQYFLPTTEMDCDSTFSIVTAGVLATCSSPGTNQSSHLIAIESLSSPCLIIWVLWRNKSEHFFGPCLYAIFLS